MIWQEVKIYTADSGVEILAAELLALGVGGWQQESAAELREYLAAGEAFDYADKALSERSMGEGAVLTLYLADDTDGAAIIEELQRRLPALKAADTAGVLGELRMAVNRRASEEWEDNWKQYYKPFKIGSRLVICPSWEEYRPLGAEKLLVIEPGGSFGTGQHYTTRLCLELLEKYLPDNAALLDLGCGTGILSIGALHLGAAAAVAVDIEEGAAAAAQNNAALNGYQPPKYRALSGDISEGGEVLNRVMDYADGKGYDIITVNIVADVIIAMSSFFGGLLAEDGRVVCSGIINERRADVLAAMCRAGFSSVEEQTENGWCAMVFKRA